MNNCKVIHNFIFLNKYFLSEKTEFSIRKLIEKELIKLNYYKNFCFKYTYKIYHTSTPNDIIKV